MDLNYIPTTVLLLILGLWVTGSNALVKRWLPTVEWNDQSQWSSKKVPCDKQTVIFQADQVFSLSVDSEMAWSTLILPLNGEIVLNIHDHAMVTSAPDSVCISEEVTFLGGQAKSWFDPKSWHIGEETETNLAVPHALRIPCPMDEVALPSLDRSVNIDFHHHTIRATKMSFGDVVFSAENLTELYSRHGNFQFKNMNTSKLIEYTNNGCDDPLGCICENENDPKVMQLVCGNSVAACQSDYTCVSAVKPKGHCCEICGALLSLDVVKERFTLNGLLGLIETLKASQSIDVFASRTAENLVQVVVTDNNDAHLSHEFAQQLQAYLLKDIPSENIYGLSQVRLQKSSPAFHIAKPWSDSDKYWATTFSLVVLAFVIAGLLITLVWVYKRQRTPDMMEVGFVRFDNDGPQPNVDVELPISGVRVEPDIPQDDVVGHLHRSTDLPTGSTEVRAAPAGLVTSSQDFLWKKPLQRIRAFANPLFGNPVEASRFTLSSLLQSANTSDGTENPTYDAMQQGESSQNDQPELKSLNEDLSAEPVANLEEPGGEDAVGGAAREEDDADQTEMEETEFQDIHLGGDDQGLIASPTVTNTSTAPVHPMLQASKRIASNFRKILRKSEANKTSSMGRTPVPMQRLQEEEKEIQVMNNAAEPIDDAIVTTTPETNVELPDAAVDLDPEPFLEDRDEKKLTATISEE